jgi:D-alanyl-lipoteichoic acid acyltransferase DltB (MBOAT superfamily)
VQLLLNPWFWVSAFALYPIQYLPLPISRTVRFGACNLVILWLLLGPDSLLVAVSLAFGIWLVGHILSRTQASGAQARLGALAIAVIFVLLVLLVVYKLSRGANLLESMVCDGGLCVSQFVLGAFVAVSFSYASLRCIDYVVSVWNGEKTTGPISLFGYLFPFHMLVAGPICLYHDFMKMNEQPLVAVSFTRLVRAVNMITTGLFYKFVIAEMLRIYAFGVSGDVAVETWFDSAFLLVYLFFDFAGYSLVALGIGYLSQVPTPVNFRTPFLSRSVTEFFTRWHMSLGVFVRKNIFIPLQTTLLRRWGVSLAYLIALGTISISFVLVGLWHQLSTAFLAWGAFLGLVMVAEKVIADRVSSTLTGWSAVLNGAVMIIGPVYVFVVISTSIHMVADQVF